MITVITIVRVRVICGVNFAACMLQNSKQLKLPFRARIDAATTRLSLRLRCDNAFFTAAAVIHLRELDS